MANKPKDDFWVELSPIKIMKAYDPFLVFDLSKDVNDYQRSPFQSKYVDPDRRRKSYHVGRIAHLMVAGWTDPIVVDWEWFGMQPTRMIVDDGHHRLCAAILLEDPSIMVLYSGPLDAVDAFRP